MFRIKKFLMILPFLYATLYGQMTDKELETILSLEANVVSLQQKIGAVERKGGNELNITFPGQYRINFYSVENDRAGEERQRASRMRMRQNIDIRFTPRLQSSVRLQMNHTNDNLTNAGDVNGNSVQVRHAYLDYRTSDDDHFKTGLVPVTEYSDDLMYSKAWGFNPLALEWFHENEHATLHIFAATLQENNESRSADDMIQYQADWLYRPGKALSLSVSSTLLRIGSANHYNLSTKAKIELKGLVMSMILLGSYTEKALLGSSYDASGTGLRMELKKDFQGLKLGVLGTWTSGTADGRGFLVPMSFYRTNSYWGYTGTVTVVSPTDTGFDGDSVNVSNNGYGMGSLQASAATVLSQDISLYIAAGWFGNTQAGSRSRDIAYDAIMIGSYTFNKYLKLDLGLSYAKIFDSLSGYSKGVSSSASFNNLIGETRQKSALFGRLQLEF